MKKIVFTISVVMLAVFLGSSAASDINAKVAQLDIDTATLDDVIRIFGEPTKYAWGNRTFKREELPVAVYCLWYPNSFHILMEWDSVSEFRFQSPLLGYVWTGTIKVGSSLDEVLDVVGQPTETVVGQSLRGVAADGVLYKDIDGRKGYCYYKPADQNVRFFFGHYKVAAIYVTRSDSIPHTSSKPTSDINAKVAQLDIDTATLKDVIKVFGEPERYLWSGNTFTKDNLPRVYIAKYPNDFGVVMVSGQVSELRFESPAAGYLFSKKIRVGSSLEEVLDVIGQPAETIISQPCDYRDGILYKDINGRNGHCYYSRRDQGVRMFFGNYKVASLYLTSRKPTKRGSFQTVKAIKSVNEFDDVRWKDLSKLNLSGRANLIATLTFNQKTVWPEQAKLPASCDPEQILKEGMNPGLGIRKLHKQGITGKGVNVAIIDQPMYLDHPEFAGKIVAYHDVGCGSESSMHGPAVTSLLVGTNCGTAPGARVYYVAAPSWTKDAAYQAEAIYWIIEQNEQLPKEKKIRVVSVSAAPSGPGSPFDKHNNMWDRACRRAEKAGILVLDCTTHRGFIGACWYDSDDPENVAKCTPGFRGRGGWSRPGCILVPTSPRTTAEEYDKGEFGYQYCGRGGLSWAIPYAAGVLALGWQIRPDLTPEQMREILFKSAYEKSKGLKVRVSNAKEFFRSASERKKKGEEIGKPQRSIQRLRHRDGNGAKIIDPEGFIRLVRRAKATRKTRRGR